MKTVAFVSAKHSGDEIVPDSEDDQSNSERLRYLQYNGDSSMIVIPSTMMVPDSEE